MSNNYEVFINTEIYENIVNEMHDTGDSCIFAEIPRVPEEWRVGTSITARLDMHTEELYDVIEKYRRHSVDILPEALDILKRDLVATDEHAAEAIKTTLARRHS